MKRNKIPKGQKGYLAYQKKNTVSRTIILFALSLAIFLTGIISTGQRENLLTIVAVLGCLPASRSAVSMIVVLRYHGIGEEDYSRIQPHVGACASLCDLVFTSYEKNFEIHHMAFRGNSLIGYTANPDCDVKKCEKHLHDMCVQNRLGDVDIRIFQELPKYINRLDTLQRLPEQESDEADKASPTKAELVCALLCSISL